MILRKLIAVLQRLDKGRQEDAKRMSAVESDLRTIKGILNATTGSVNVRGAIITSPEELRIAMQDKGQFDLECVHLDIEFSSALYTAISPRNREKIEELVESKQVSYLKSVLENHKKLNEMAEFCEEFMADAADNLQANVTQIQNNVKRHLSEGKDSVIGKMNISANLLSVQNAKIDKALKILDVKIKEVDKMHVQVHSVMANHVKPKSKIFRPEKS